MTVSKIKSAIQYSEGRSSVWGGAKLVNCFAEMSEGDKADQFAVMALPGLVPFANLGNEPIRGTHTMDGVLYVVSGSTLYSVGQSGAGTFLGTVGGSLPVMMADNGSQLAIQGGVLNNQGYVLDSGTLQTSITNLPAVSNVVYIDGYFIWSVYQSDQFIISGLNDGLSYDPLDVATVEGDPDDIVGVINDHRELQFYGSKTVEIWYNSGNADFPFERQGNAFIERGLIDRNSLVKIDNSVNFVGGDRIVYRMNGYVPDRISTHAIEYKIQNANWFRAFIHTIGGHKFYVLNTDMGTWAYDMATGAWAERKSLGKSNYRAWYSEIAYGEQAILGDGYTGKLYTMDWDVNTEDGEVIPVEIVLPNIAATRAKSTLYSFELYCETGVGNSLDPDPQVILQYSRDGGRTWSTELWRPLGQVGEYLTRAIWRIGVQFRQLQLRIKMPSITRRIVVNGWADIR